MQSVEGERPSGTLTDGPLSLPCRLKLKCDKKVRMNLAPWVTLTQCCLRCLVALALAGDANTSVLQVWHLLFYIIKLSELFQGTNASPNVRQAVAAASSSKAQDGSDADIDSKLAAMSERIRALEDALAVESSESHPLLSPELLAIKQGIDSIDSYADRADGDDAENEMLSAFGTLSVSEGKTMRFLGASAAEVSWNSSSFFRDAYLPTRMCYLWFVAFRLIRIRDTSLTFDFRRCLALNRQTVHCQIIRRS